MAVFLYSEGRHTFLRIRFIIAHGLSECVSWKTSGGVDQREGRRAGHARTWDPEALFMTISKLSFLHAFMRWIKASRAFVRRRMGVRWPHMYIREWMTLAVKINTPVCACNTVHACLGPIGTLIFTHPSHVLIQVLPYYSARISPRSIRA